jgi:NADP-dependent aldehyde dehydrogenase
MSEVFSTNPVTGVATSLGIHETSVEEVAQMGRRSMAAAAQFATRSLEWRAGLLEVMAQALDDEGAVAIVVRYAERDRLLEALSDLEPALTFTVHAESDDEWGPVLIDVGRQLAGRVIVNGFPTGVWVSWSMHGGPHLATTSPLHTSVGATSMRRWLRPVSYQSVPDAWLPESIKEDNPLGIVRRVDGQLRP